jgi:hypothetical protein
MHMTTSTSFWKNAAASLPPEVRHRYAADLEAAERFEELFDLGIEACGVARRALTKVCLAAAQALRKTAAGDATAIRRRPATREQPKNQPITESVTIHVAN